MQQFGGRWLRQSSGEMAKRRPAQAVVCGQLNKHLPLKNSAKR
ncbi:hypothetical protein RESH_03546 [Rhodopirellula europaea SH398]|uniref:Uncharacterized protein n=1 Tax=Rhodopirellula europaea SH398 TaxID=1263868 RepID=M5S320_9BACT|nr:hypothetical protein RESH_03546 [Rhodopirellula europaea SH398]